MSFLNIFSVKTCGFLGDLLTGRSGGGWECRREWFLNVGLLGLGIFLVPAFFAKGANPNDFEVFNYDLRDDGAVELPGRLFIPQDYDAASSYPIVIFFHGSGEEGTNNTSQVGSAINNLLANAKSRDFFLYAPQLASGSGSWSVTSIDNTMRMVANAVREYNIDPGRIYVTGYSLGGGGTWAAASRYSDIIAGAVPISGSVGASVKSDNLVDLPIWAFHARNDTTVQSLVSRRQVDAIRGAEGLTPLSYPSNSDATTTYYHEERGLRYTEYPTGGHNIVGSVYGKTEVYDWMLDKSKAAEDISLHVGEKILLDFGIRQPTYNTTTQSYVPDSQGKYWNSTYINQEATLGTALPFVQTDTGRRTSVTLDVAGIFGSRAQNGVQEGSPFDLDIGTDGWVTAASGEAVLTLRGLTANEYYQLELYASNDNSDVNRGRMTRYQIGDVIKDLQVYNNVDNMVVFDYVQADDQGWIDLHVLPEPGSGARYGQINTLSIMALGAVPEPSTLGLLALGVLVVGARRLFWKGSKN